MTEHLKQRLLAKFTRLIEYKKIITLDMPDDYQFMDPELIEILKSSIDYHL